MKSKPVKIMMALVLAIALCLPDIAYAMGSGGEVNSAAAVTGQGNAKTGKDTHSGAGIAAGTKTDKDTDLGSENGSATNAEEDMHAGTVVGAETNVEEDTIMGSEAGAEKNTEEDTQLSSGSVTERNKDGSNSVDSELNSEVSSEPNSAEDSQSITQTNSNDTKAENKTIHFSERICGEFQDGILTVTGEGKIPDLQMNGENPIDAIKAEIESIILEDGITEIGDYAFRNCLNAEILRFPDSVKSIGKYAFAENYCLSKVQLPSNLEIIKEGAFSRDSNLQVEKFPVSLKKIETYAFFNCFKIGQNVTKQEGITISEDAFFQYPRYVELDIISYDKTNSRGERNYIGSLYFHNSEITNELQDTDIQHILKQRSDQSEEKYKDLSSYYNQIIKKQYPGANIKYSVSIIDKQKDLKNAVLPRASSVRNASTQAELEAAIKQSGSGDIINITKNLTLKNVVITNKNITIRASGGNRTITPANGNNVTAFIINGNSKVTFAATGTHTASNGSVADNKLYIGSGTSKGTGNCINSSNVIVQGTSRVTINSNVLVRNSRYHTVYGDPNTTIVLDGGSIMNTKEITAVNGGGNTFGIGSYGTIRIKSGKIYCESPNRKMQYGQGVHSNGGTIEVTGGSIYNCNVGVGVNHGNGANGGNKEDAYATFSGGYIYNNDVGIQINNSMADISSAYVGLTSYTNADTFKVSSNTTYGIAISNKSEVWIESAGRIYHTGKEAVHNEGTLDITSYTNGNRTKIWGNAEYGIRNTSIGYVYLYGANIDGARTGVLNENAKKESCRIENSPYSTQSTVIQNCSLRGILNNGNLSITTVDHGLGNRVEIINNGGADKGGGIYNNTGRTCLLDAQSRDADSIRINSNKGNFGGGIYNDGAVTLNGSVSVSSNTASASGGAVYNNNKLIMNSGRILNNIASTYGGGIMNKNTLSVSGGEIGGNRAAANSGGGICNDGGTQGVTTSLIISNGKIYGNTSSKGSGIEQHGNYNPKMTIKGGWIYGNNGGYGIHNEAGTVELKDGAGMGFSAWTNSTAFTSSNNGEGNIYNKGNLIIQGSQNAWICLASTTNYNINNFGTCTINSSGNYPVITGKSTHAVDNSGQMAIDKVLILNAQSGIYNSSNININGGGIYGCSAYGVYNTVTGNVNMGNADIHDNKNYGTGAGVYNLGTFSMTSGFIRNNTSSGGGGVQNNGIFKLTGGEIKENISARLGGGVRNDGTFIMSGGGINGNTAANGGGGIFSGRNNDLTITGGTIKNNKVTAGNGGGIYTDTHDSKTLSLTNATISGNVVTGGNGGGIYYNSSVILESNLISGNTAVTGGGIVFVGSANTMKSGSVANNTASSWGGGIQVLSGSSLVLNNASIYGNTAPNDGGINNDGTISMTGGTIHSNKCKSGNNGGGIRLGNAGASFTVTGGRIYGNNGYGIVNVLGTVNLESTTSDNNTGTLIGFEKFEKAWSGLVQAKTESNQNSIGAIYNADRLNAKGVVHIYSGTTYGIYNRGKLNMSDGAKCTLFGNADFGIYNESAGTMTIGEGNQIWLAKTGLKNEGTATLNGGTLTENTKRGVENSGNFNLYKGEITNNGKEITPKFFPSGFIDSNEMGNSIYQNGNLNVKGNPYISQDIFLTPDHFITMVDTCETAFITSLDKNDTFQGRILANYKFNAKKQTEKYSLESHTKEFAEAKEIVIDDQTGIDAEYPYQVLLDGKKVLINYLPNGGNGEMIGDVVPLEADYVLRDNEFVYDRHSYVGWDPEANKQSTNIRYQPGQVVVPSTTFLNYIKIASKNNALNKISLRNSSVSALVEAYGKPVSRALDNIDYDYLIELNAIWNEAPIIDTTILEFYEGEIVRKDQLMNEIYLSEDGATDKEDGFKMKEVEYYPHLLDDQVKIIGIEYNPIENGYQPIENKIIFDEDMPVDYYLDTYDKKGMLQNEVVNHKLIFKVLDSTGNDVTVESDVRILYNNYPTLKVPETLFMTTEDLSIKSLTENTLKSYAKANDIEDDAAKNQGLSDANGNTINIQEKVEILNIQDVSGNMIQSEHIHDVGSYFVTYSVKDRFGKETQKTMKLMVVEPAELSANNVEYVRFISLEYLDTLDKHSKWNKEELKAILNNKNYVKTITYTHDDVVKIKDLMKELNTKEDFEYAIDVIKEQYIDE
ncbi:leucine-rich repeat protein [uncultured Robinsoniella sp.]|uniref:leucine-rich repeat protein n=1 Tax=uncultured Robinsoniella sp. TaxID=904190 RepID=UPI00374F4F3C